MEANGAPEKVYISDSELNDAEHCIIWFKSQQNKNDIEYIRKDSIIEWLKDCSTYEDFNGNTCVDEDLFNTMVENFKKYMED